MTDPIDMAAVREAVGRWGREYKSPSQMSVDAWRLADFAARILDMPPEVRSTVESFAEPAAMSRDAVARKAIEALMVTKWFAGVMKGSRV